MSGRGIGRGRRHHTTNRDQLQTISKEAARKLARRAGVKRVDAEIIANVGQGGITKGKPGQGILLGLFRNFVYTIAKDAVIYTEYRRGKIVTGKDVLFALKKHNKTLHLHM